MKDKIGVTAGIIVCLAIVACSKQTTIEKLDIDVVPKNSEQYAENLRAYKKTDHPVYFGWFAGFGSEGDSTRVSVLDQIPDSVDIVSCWGGVPPKGSHNHNLLLSTQKNKGTRFIRVTFTDKNFLDVSVGGDFVGKYDTDDETLKKGFDIIAQKLKDYNDEYGLDGIDFDHEPNIFGGGDWGLLKDDRKFNMFLTSVSKFFGPLSGSQRLLIVDGEYEMITGETGKALSYIATQAYYTGDPASLNYRFSSTPENFPASKFIVTENFESLWQTGGTDYLDPTHGIVPSLLGMAYWNPSQGRKGGAGSYHTEYEYALNPDYKYTRAAIQIMNPAAK